MAFNADIATATAWAPQLGTLSGTTTPTSTQAGVIWARAENETKLALLAAGLSATVTASSIAALKAGTIEALLTSGWCLLAKGSVGKDAKSTALDLLREAERVAAGLWGQRDMLLGNGATAAGTPLSVHAASHWTKDLDPDFDETPGTGDRPYAGTPILDEGDDL